MRVDNEGSFSGVTLPLELRHGHDTTFVCMPRDKSVLLTPEETLQLASDLLTFVDPGMSAAVNDRLELYKDLKRYDEQYKERT